MREASSFSDERISAHTACSLNPESFQDTRSKKDKRDAQPQRQEHKLSAWKKAKV